MGKRITARELVRELEQTYSLLTDALGIRPLELTEEDVKMLEKGLPAYVLGPSFEERLKAHFQTHPYECLALEETRHGLVVVKSPECADQRKLEQEVATLSDAFPAEVRTILIASNLLKLYHGIKRLYDDLRRLESSCRKARKALQAMPVAFGFYTSVPLPPKAAAMLATKGISPEYSVRVDRIVKVQPVRVGKAYYVPVYKVVSSGDPERPDIHMAVVRIEGKRIAYLARPNEALSYLLAVIYCDKASSANRSMIRELLHKVERLKKLVLG